MGEPRSARNVKRSAKGGESAVPTAAGKRHPDGLTLRIVDVHRREQHRAVLGDAHSPTVLLHPCPPKILIIGRSARGHGDLEHPPPESGRAERAVIDPKELSHANV